MNSIQQALAAVTGLDDVLEAQEAQTAALNGLLEAREAEVAARAAELEELKTANEQIYSDYTLLSRRFEDLLYIDLTGGGTSTVKDDVITDEQRKAVLNRLRRLRHENPLAKQAIKLTLRFVFGKNINYTTQDTSDQRILDEFWRDPNNQEVLTGRNAMTRYWDEVLTDGEKFLVMVTGKDEVDGITEENAEDGPPHARLAEIPVEELTQILYDPDARQVPVWYKRTYQRYKYDPKANGNSGAWVPIDSTPINRYYLDYRITAAQLLDIEGRGLNIPLEMRGKGRVKHIYINPVRMRSGLRGISELFASREWFRVFKEFMEDRGAINAAANAFAFQRKIKGGPAAVARLSGRLGGVATTPDTDQPNTFDMRRLTRPLPGATYDSTDNVDLKGVRLDTGAPNAREDARLLLMAAGAGVATPINYFGDVNVALAGTQSVELPLVKAYEDTQSAVKVHLQEIAEFVIGTARGTRVEPGDIRIAWEFPPIITADIVKWVTAYAQLAQQIAPQNRAVKRIAIRGGLVALNTPNVDMEMDAIDEEEERIFQEREEQRQLQLDAAKNAAAGMPGGAPGGFSSNGKNGKNGKKPEDGQTSGGGPQLSAINADTMRLTRGRPPRETTTGPRSRRQ